MRQFVRKAFQYTPYFCEENIWWLARALAETGVAERQQQVLLFSNPEQSIVAMQQRNADVGQPLVWDYHVALRVQHDDEDLIFDFDTRMPFPVSSADYLQSTFPPQSRLLPRLRTHVRRIPADHYLTNFHSDRSHMVGRLPQAAFPDYPPIQATAASTAVSLVEYRDMLNGPMVNCPVFAVEALLDS